ncbi:hypothetical protein BD289DRAFT_434025 [Coniella lustricola]|uniref:Uncharacterized protein n=1 Tax=Coniella lustricola TaxID=2025994 RepID=A0A2T3A7Z4_9PEZI|nr:hypothetical protein BD289DRAFT_434025 [Coniella lustricola]
MMLFSAAYVWPKKLLGAATGAAMSLDVIQLSGHAMWCTHIYRAIDHAIQAGGRNPSLSLYMLPPHIRSTCEHWPSSPDSVAQCLREV